MLASNTILQNRYRLLRELGHGGMGTVYEALDQRVNCIVALKETLSTSDGEARKAFEREAALLANLRHQALPKVMDYFSESDGDFLVMEFIPGHDLAELLELRGNPFPQDQVLRWADELLNVLEYLHGQRPPILHRDIKPSNLKLTKQGEIFLLDFGLAKGSVGQMPTLATSHSVRGYTPLYASLEQIHGHGTDARSEIYSVGATLYHLLTGEAPVDAPTRFHAVEDGNADPLQPIEELNPLVSPAIAGIIYQAVAVSRKHRPATVADMRQSLTKVTKEEERRAAVRAIEKGKLSTITGDARDALDTDEAPRDTNEMSARERTELPTTMPPAAIVQSEAPPAESRPNASTLRGRSPENIHTQGKALAGVEQSSPSGSRRALVAAAVIVVLLGAAATIWFLLRANRNDLPVNQPQLTARLPDKPPDKQPLAGPAAPNGMVYVPGGVFTMGRDNGDDAERPQHQMTVKPFFIDAYEVTNEDYAKFIKATNHRAPANWKNGSFPVNTARQPVTGVAWDDANDYSRWAGKRLPTEEEWEFAARGTDGRLYPWGNEWQAAANANGAEQTVSDSGAYKGSSPFGTYDMVGNAWEWTASNFRAYPGRGLPSSQPTGELKVIRGGCYESTKDYATTTYRAGWPARGAPTYEQTGFRAAKDVGP